MSSRIGYYLELAVWTIGLSVSVLLGYWILILPQITLVILMLIAAIGACWIYTLFRRSVSVPVTPLDSGLSLLWLVLLLTTFLSTDPSRSWPMVWMWSICLFVYYMSVVAFRTGWQVETFAKGLFLVLGIALLANYLQLYIWLQEWYAVTEWPGPLPPRLLRVWGITNSPNVFAILLNMTLMLAIAYPLNRKKSMATRALLPLSLWFLFALPMLIIPGSRSGWISASLGIVTLIIGNVWLNQQGANFFSAKIIGRLVSIILLICVAVISLVVWRRPETLQLDFGNSVNYRLPFWRIALDSWSEFFWFGTGPNTYGTTYMLNVNVPFQTAYMDAHSIFFNTLTEMGIVGIFALFFFLSQFVRFIWQRRRSSGWNFLTIGLLATLITFGGYSVFDTPETWVGLLACICLAALIAQLDQNISANKHDIMRDELLVRYSTIGLWVFLLVVGFIGWQANRSYTAGIIAMELNDWTRAASQFETAESWLPYADSGVAVAKGLSYGMLAMNEPNYLAQAEDALVQVVRAEPGWPLNHANLAAVYWEQGKRDEAIKAMQTAIVLSPEMPLLYLNLGLWYEAEGNGEAAQAIYENLYNLARTPRAIPFWEETDIRRAAASQAIADGQPTPYRSPGYIALDSNPVIAVELFLEEISLYPNLPTAYLGLGIAYAQLGDRASAAKALQMAQALDAGHATVRLYGSQRLFINLWQTILADDQPARLLQGITEQNMLQYGNYSLTLFGRLDPPYDLLPQLHCFNQTPLTARHLHWLHTLYNSQSTISETEQTMLALVNQLRDSAGVQLCQVMESR